MWIIGFREANLLKDHVNVHTGLTPYYCKLCGTGYPTSSALRLHKAYKHSGSFNIYWLKNILNETLFTSIHFFNYKNLLLHRHVWKQLYSNEAQTVYLIIIYYYTRYNIFNYNLLIVMNSFFTNFREETKSIYIS